MRRSWGASRRFEVGEPGRRSRGLRGRRGSFPLWGVCGGDGAWLLGLKKDNPAGLGWC